ncbi:GNAT family N-acetyltransferase [Streptomyces apocyni]|uniref:GNAT family N-acetyltransferase n=1 Tax=Streptomyces apocyni TaxID=2654677 RepID=UPI0012EAF476|nr:GNAT family N-acetyltransferase [Streptomyces apocyni]
MTVDGRVGDGRLDIGVLDPGDWDAWFSNLELAFGGIREDDENRGFDRAATVPERSLVVRDGPKGGAEIVAGAGSFPFRLTVPGGALVPSAGVTMVGVKPTHRRRGLLSALMRRQLDDVRALGEPLAILTASEPAIYGRFGYGAATQQLMAEIETSRVRLAVPDGTDDVRLRLVPPAEVLDACEAVYARLVPGRPGMLARVAPWERHALIDPAEDRGGASPLQCLVAERAGEIVGYARFHVKPDWTWTSTHEGTVQLRDLDALDPAAYAALLRYLLDLDLISTVQLRNRPVDDAWQQMVSDVRRCNVRVRDSLYVRLVEVGAALEARTYQTPVDVVFDVEDDFCPWNAGRWRLTGDAKGASCERTEDAADVALSVRELGAAYLGGVSLVSLAAAGRVRELRGGAVAQASVAFGSAVAPWLPHGF